MNYTIDHCHNFCESRVNNFNGPELYNAYSSIPISFIPIIYGFPKDNIFFLISILYLITGYSSFHYHYYLNNFGKQFDEIPMILSLFFGYQNILKVYCDKNKKLFNVSTSINVVFMVLFIVFNSDYRNDIYFQDIFTIYLIPLLYLMKLNYDLYNIKYIDNLKISGLGAVAWLSSELLCNNYTKYGHILWHLLFPVGVYKIVLEYDYYLFNKKLID